MFRRGGVGMYVCIYCIVPTCMIVFFLHICKILICNYYYYHVSHLDLCTIVYSTFGRVDRRTLHVYRNDYRILIQIIEKPEISQMNTTCVYTFNN